MSDLRIQKAVKDTHGDVKKLVKLSSVLSDCFVYGLIDSNEYAHADDFFLDEIKNIYGSEVLDSVFRALSCDF